MDIQGFEGAFKARSDGQWAIGYNSEQSPGRVLFTLAHEFGHCMLHDSCKVPSSAHQKMSTIGSRWSAR
ncbi:ImmA/IrrE family metallo-endopeptidase [Xanthomonas arboricola pv. juglandis]